MKARERINDLADKLITNLSENGYVREEMRRVLMAAVRKLGPLGVKRAPKVEEVEQ